MITIKSKKEIEQLRKAGQLVIETFKNLESFIQPGISLRELDEYATRFLTEQGAETLYKGYKQMPDQPPFPGVITASINSEICHGIPDKRTLRDGDIVGIDIGLRYQGWCGDACVTYAVGKISKQAARLMKVAKECLHLGIQAAQPGKHISDIGAAIQTHAYKHSYSVVREFGGHGIGQDLHESPFVSHVGSPGKGVILRPGMVITVEPMINIGSSHVRMKKDGWTAVTADGSLSAQFEHTIAITDKGPDILTSGYIH